MVEAGGGLDMRRALALTVWACLFSLLLLATAACGAGSGYDSASTAFTAPASPSAALPQVASLRDVDFTQQPYLGDLVTRASGGEVTRERVRLVDLTGDGVEEAVVPVESGGTMGDIGVAIYRLDAGTPSLALFRRLAGRVEVRGTEVVISEGVPAPTDPACCPSRVRETTLGWNGTTFAPTSERTVDANR
jgi:hypothetical protein